ncbi:MAG: cytochrome-c peroxidase [Bacteroidetes bacterium]|nr:cytochrome-c peroxidase [Bacteroidota bacterium]
MRKFNYLYFIAVLLFFSCRKNTSEPQDSSGSPTPFQVQLPSGFGWKMFSIPSDNPLTVEGVALGEKLFNDPILSANNTQSCATCHKPEFAYSDFGNQFSEGAFGQRGNRNTPALFNLAWNETYNLTSHRWFWDGGKADLEQQAVGPITNPIEMANDLKVMVQRLQNHSQYPGLFRKAFGSDTITVSRVVKAIAQFERSLISSNSPYDQAERRERQRTPSEFRGMQLFVSEKGDCFHCHGSLSSPFFTNFSFHNIGLDKFGADSGLYRITGNPADLYKFKTPSLRNLLFTAPYMHDGRFKTLEEVIEFYSSGIQPSPTLDPNIEKHIKDGGLALNPMEKADLLAFLHSLSDSSFLKVKK